ncbi:ABC transporter substrate-binding protein [Chryseobacterium sp.]|uniref:ABC transporter substrate-binding protein n=1 Tax=Chryseobacterium sp. TaxID=1871047 RepID=UPI0011CA2923|nr:helical backbone metal receptor [Chryseobacterium sp.]TXF77656.1 ABC transporter substrate-binding protein [Chryseobacterium sp.]
MKIISLVPSITETLFDFGLTDSEVVGRTKFCIHPEDSVKKVTVIGGTKNLNIEKIRSLKPDLIIANKEENEKLQVEELEKEFKVWVTDIKNLRDNENFLQKLGTLLNKEETAQNYVQKIRTVFGNLSKEPSKKTAYLIWKAPYMTVGNDTFIHHILEQLGFDNIFKNQKRYPVISIEEMQSAEYLLLSSEPFPFREKHMAELQSEIPTAKIILVEGEAFSWYGTPLLKWGPYYKSLLENL